MGKGITIMIGDNKIGERIDRKFSIMAKCIEHDHVYDHNHAVLFLAKDKALVKTLAFYMEECRNLNATSTQLTGIALLIERVKRYQEANKDIVKVADIDADTIAGASITEPNKETR